MNDKEQPTAAITIANMGKSAHSIPKPDRQISSLIVQVLNLVNAVLEVGLSTVMSLNTMPIRHHSAILNHVEPIK